MIDHVSKSYFVKVPKTAGTSVLDALLDSRGSARSSYSRDEVTNVNMASGFRISRPFRIPGRGQRFNAWHVSARDIRRWLGPERWPKYRGLAIVRNPFDRVVSLFEYQRGKGRQPERFVDFVAELTSEATALSDQARLHALPQAAWISSPKGRILVDYVIRFEHLGEGLAALPQDRFPLARIGHQNASERRPWQEYYDDEVARAVRDLYRVDFNLLDYSAEWQPGEV